MSKSPADILLVEDNPSDVELALLAFRRENLVNRIQVVRDGAEALDFLFHTGPFAGLEPGVYPRVILLDLKLPKIDGFEVLRRVRANNLTRMLPVVVLTSSREDRDIHECYCLGANSYMVKPIEFEKFIELAGILSKYWLQYNLPPVD
jgi:CheY-like chemotaxis protein